MYGFVEVTEPGTKAKMSIQTVFNEVNLDESLTDDKGSFKTLSVTGRNSMEQKINTMGVFGQHGMWEEDKAYREPREIEVKFKLKDKTNSGFIERFKKMKSYLEGSKKHLEFTDEDAIFYATLSVLEVPEEDSNDLVGSLVFYCSDPDKYGPIRIEEYEDDSLVVENKGTAETEPTFELTAKEKTTFAMISNGTDEDSHYNLIGVPTEVDEEVVDTRRQLFEERGQTLDEWTKSGTEIDGGDVVGELNTDNDGITVPSYGSGDKWHGPALLREIEPIQNFEVEMMLRMETKRSEQTVRIEMYLFDENMDNLGKMAIWDNDKSGNEKKGEARYGEKGDHWERYAISSRNYKYRNDMWFGMLRFTREGDRMKFYITRINTRNKHVKSIEESVRVDDELMGRLKYVQIHIGKYADTSNANAPRILSIKASELYEETVDQTPYIIYPGDLITFDHKDEEILINGENRKELKNFGGTFFPLKKGYNTIITYPDGAFDTNITLRDKYL